MIRILVTGFGAFPGARRNPSAELAALLERDQARRLARLGIVLSVGMLPVVFGEVAMALEGLAARDAPDAILHLGLASRAKRIAVEAVARNRIATLHPDAMRRTATERRVLASGAAQLRASIPVAQAAQLLRAQGFAAHFSNDAGSYVCNQTLYLSLARGHVAGFIHIPRANRLGALAQALVPVLVLVAAAVRRPAFES